MAESKAFSELTIDVRVSIARKTNWLAEAAQPQQDLFLHLKDHLYGMLIAQSEIRLI